MKFSLRDSVRFFCLMRGVSGTKAKAVIIKVLFKDWLDDLTYGLLKYAISDRNSERS
ncbi:hypothetical protein PaeBR_23360 [Paenibacillus sp. BR2-3]|uniref:hypothetical protein n=1 Tax=Paenibacillus sp. BR2-3 TaxID=3048494 RepID=UPI003977669B